MQFPFVTADTKTNIQQKTNESFRSVQHSISQFVVNVGDPSSNIITQAEKFNKVYSVPKANVGKFFELLEKCRKEQCVMSFAEKQFVEPTIITSAEGIKSPSEYETYLKTGIMLDFDIYQKENETQLTEMHFHRLIEAILTTLTQIIDFVEPTAIVPKLVRAVILNKAELFYDETRKAFKDSFHILFPEIWIEKAAKRFLINRLLESKKLDTVFRGLQFNHEYEKALDTNSYCVPPLLLGCSKKNKPPHLFHSMFSVNVMPDNYMQIVKDPTFDAPDCAYNLAYECSLLFQNPKGYLRKCEYNIKAGLEDQVKVAYQRADQNVADQTKTDEDLSILSLHDPNFPMIEKLMSLINIDQVEHKQYITILHVLAGMNERYKAIAEKFCQRSKHWKRSGFETEWERALKAPVKTSSIRTLHYLAKIHNPEKYHEVHSLDIQTEIINIAIAEEGAFPTGSAAKLIHHMLCNKFVVDSPPHADKNTHVWFEFVLPSDPMKKGEVFKYRREVEPDNLYLYMNEKLPILFNNVLPALQERRSTATEKSLQKWWDKLIATFKNSRRKFQDNGYKKSVIDEAKRIFKRNNRGFLDQLDQDGTLFGVGNGVLRLGATVELITSFHEYKISKYTEIDYVPYNAESPYIKKVEELINDVFPEPDAKLYIMCLIASSLDGLDKNPVLLKLFGGGANGKSTLTEFLLRMLNVNNSGYGRKLPVQFLLEKRPDSGKPDPVMMELKTARSVIYSEPEFKVPLNTARLKEVLGLEVISCRGLFGQQENFTPHCNHIIMTNHDLEIETTDHGTWRRIKYYRFKRQFRPDPDPNNPFQKKMDIRWMSEYKYDPNMLSAFLSICCQYYEIYFNKYNRNLDNIPHPTIMQETEEFRNKNDTINLFISLYVKPAHSMASTEPRTYSMQDVADKYTEWYSRNINTCKKVKGDIITCIENSCLSKFIRPNRFSEKTLYDHVIIYGQQAAVIAAIETASTMDDELSKMAEELS